MSDFSTVPHGLLLHVITYQYSLPRRLPIEIYATITKAQAALSDLRLRWRRTAISLHTTDEAYNAREDHALEIHIILNYSTIDIFAPKESSHANND